MPQLDAHIDMSGDTMSIARYFTELMDRQKGAKYFIGSPRDMVTGECKDTFIQVMNAGFPGGLMSVDQAVQMMNKSCYKG